VNFPENSADLKYDGLSIGT